MSFRAVDCIKEMEALEFLACKAEFISPKFKSSLWKEAKDKLENVIFYCNPNKYFYPIEDNTKEAEAFHTLAKFCFKHAYHYESGDAEEWNLLGDTINNYAAILLKQRDYGFSKRP